MGWTGLDSFGAGGSRPAGQRWAGERRAGRRPAWWEQRAARLRRALDPPHLVYAAGSPTGWRWTGQVSPCSGPPRFGSCSSLWVSSPLLQARLHAHHRKGDLGKARGHKCFHTGKPKRTPSQATPPGCSRLAWPPGLEGWGSTQTPCLLATGTGNPEREQGYGHFLLDPSSLTL